MNKKNKKPSLFKVGFLFATIFVFAKIYQHNKIVKLMYEHQKIENQKELLRKEKNKLLVQWHNLTNKNRVKKLAQEKLKLQPIKLSQLITVSSDNSYSTTN